MEGQHYLKNGKLQSLSAQNVLDCDYESNGCGGGNVPNAYNYIIKAKGVDTDVGYPYTGVRLIASWLDFN